MGPFSNVDINLRPEVYSDVISGAVVDPTGVKVPVNLVIQSKTVLEIYHCFNLLRTTPTDGPYANRAKRNGGLPKKAMD